MIIIIIIIITITIIIIISFMQAIYTYIPGTNYVPREYTVAAIPLLLFMVLISLVSVLNIFYFYSVESIVLYYYYYYKHYYYYLLFLFFRCLN